MSWFRRITKGILTGTDEKKDVPSGLWYRCEGCRATMTTKEHRNNCYVCPQCDRHERVGADAYFDLLFDKNTKQELFNNIFPIDVLDFTDLKPYKKRLQQTQRQTGLTDALQTASGLLDGKALVVAAMDFSFIGGSMGSVVGEKIARAIDYCIAERKPLLIISKSGGARMMESAFSLMQMAKTSAKLTQLAQAGLPFFSLMTDPTTGGVTASFAMLGDINMAEPAALIGFAGPRVIKETIKRDLPENFQTSEFLMEKGFLDLIVHRKELRTTISNLLDYFAKLPPNK